ncbi:MAG: WGR domain-containing protein [Hyphomicrobiaceae bacterium]
MRLHLERVAPEKHMARFYTVLIAPTLLGEWSLIREWGRIGQGGTVREMAYVDEAAATAAALRIVAVKQRRGYRHRG